MHYVRKQSILFRAISHLLPLWFHWAGKSERISSETAQLDGNISTLPHSSFFRHTHTYSWREKNKQTGRAISRSTAEPFGRMRARFDVHKVSRRNQCIHGYSFYTAHCVNTHRICAALADDCFLFRIEIKQQQKIIIKKLLLKSVWYGKSRWYASTKPASSPGLR